MSREIGPLPLIVTGSTTLIALLPGELSPRTARQGQVSRDGAGIRVRIPEATLLFDLRAERDLRVAHRLLLVEAEGGQSRLLGELTITWDL
jgi:hypothetical protein